LILELRDQNIKVKTLRYEDAGENKALEDKCKSKVLGFVFEYAGPRIPLRIEKVERMFQTLYHRIRAVFNGSGLQEEIRSGIWAEYTSNSTFYSTILATRVTKRCPQELLFGKEAHCAHNSIMISKMGIVTTKKVMNGKLKVQGFLHVYWIPSKSCL
jgi:hypothetical protein